LKLPNLTVVQVLPTPYKYNKYPKFNLKKHFEVTTGTDKKCDRISVFTKEHTFILRARGLNIYNKNGFLCEYPANNTGQTVTLCWQNLVVIRVAVMARKSSIIV
jgi:hypothetical protein